MLSANGHAAPLVVSDEDWPGVVRAVGDLSQDMGRVTGHDAPVVKDEVGGHDEVVLIGTIGKSPLIDELVRRHKLDVSGIRGPVGIGGDDHRRPPDAGSATGAGDRGRR